MATEPHMWQNFHVLQFSCFMLLIPAGPRMFKLQCCCNCSNFPTQSGQATHASQDGGLQLAQSPQTQDFGQHLTLPLTVPNDLKPDN